MYEALTEEQVKARILARLKTPLLTCEGSFTGDIIAAMATEICHCYHAMDALESMFYVDETSGTYIDKQASAVGITRKVGTLASCTVTFNGTDGATVPAGAPFYTAAGLAFYLEGAATIADGTASGTLTAAEVGAAYNIGAGEIVSTLRNYSGITGYANHAATGGTDAETDAALVSRYYARMQRSPTSGNPYHYQMWAGEVDGVGYSRVIAKWNGDGTVKVLLASPEGGAVDAEIVSAAAAHIGAERPVGPKVTVLSATAKILAVSAAVTIDGTTTKAAVQTALEKAVGAYFKSLVAGSFTANLDAELDVIPEKTYTVLYNRVAFLLLSIPGVVDYTALTVGGGTANISVAADEVPVLGEVSVS
ncbi:baseplate J-like family protein [Oscillibacter valericigenes Sjm18-20]|nr:baseplate J-like family protein [Oscillibacter valericigenes Sjm18-20]